MPGQPAWKSSQNQYRSTLTFNSPQLDSCPPGTPHSTAGFPDHQQNICLESLSDPLPEHMARSATNHRPSNRSWEWQSPSHLPVTGSCMWHLCGHTLYVFLSSPSKRHHNIWVAMVLSVQTTAKAHPKRRLKQPCYFERGRENCPNVEVQQLLALAPRLKQEAEGLHFPGKQHVASLQAQEAPQTSTFPRDSIHPNTVILHPNWQQSCMQPPAGG